MQLFTTLDSPYGRKIRVVLAEKNLPFELVEDAPWSRQSRIPGLNPLGKVPVLVTDDGEAFFDSPVVAGYLETLPSALPLLPASGVERVRVRQSEALADGILDAGVAIFLEGIRPAEQQIQANITRQLAKINSALDSLEKRLQGRQWLNGDSLQLGDLATANAIAFVALRVPRLEWKKDRPALTAYAEGLLARPSFETTKPPER
ncbi:glutathione S-transferase [Betaproteobacteria bacterium]|nr:glutathione S-transferase [Betaproteobacteria bacterium]